jgi:hypothetical protein
MCERERRGWRLLAAGPVFVAAALAAQPVQAQG